MEKMTYDYSFDDRREVHQQAKIVDTKILKPEQFPEPHDIARFTPLEIVHMFEIIDSEEGYKNFLDAMEKRYIAPASLEGGSIFLEMMPLERNILPDTFYHLAELSVCDREMNKHAEEGVWGSESKAENSYLQTPYGAVAPNFDAYRVGKRLARLSVDRDAVLAYRDIFLDYDSIGETPEEYMHAFMLRGGIPKKAITKIDILEITAAAGGSVVYPTYEGKNLTAEQKAKREQVMWKRHDTLARRRQESVEARVRNILSKKA